MSLEEDDNFFFQMDEIDISSMHYLQHTFKAKK